jgi:hypothetical protein
MLRRKHVGQTGGLDIAYAWTCEDYEFFWRVSGNGLGALIEAPSMLYRIDAEDQLTKPHLLLYIARGNLIALQRRYQKDRGQINLPRLAMRRHMADAHLWVAYQELVADSGKRKKAIFHFLRGFSLNPFHGKHFARFLFRLMFPKYFQSIMRTAWR